MNRIPSASFFAVATVALATLLEPSTARASIIAYGVEFGGVTIGTTATAKVKFLYQGEDQPPARLLLGGEARSQFSIRKNDCKILTPYAVCSVTVQFTPASTGTSKAFVQIQAGGDVATASISGHGLLPADDQQPPPDAATSSLPTYPGYGSN